MKKYYIIFFLCYTGCQQLLFYSTWLNKKKVQYSCSYFVRFTELFDSDTHKECLKHPQWELVLSERACLCQLASKSRVFDLSTVPLRCRRLRSLPGEWSWKHTVEKTGHARGHEVTAETTNMHESWEKERKRQRPTFKPELFKLLIWCCKWYFWHARKCHYYLTDITRTDVLRGSVTAADSNTAKQDWIE